MPQLRHPHTRVILLWWEQRRWKRGKGREDFFFFTLVTGPRRSLSLKLSDARVYEPQVRARLSTISHFCGQEDEVEDHQPLEIAHIVRWTFFEKRFLQLSNDVPRMGRLALNRFCQHHVCVVLSR